MSNGNESIQSVGPYMLKKVKPGPTTAGIAPTYAICTPDRWGMRYSDLDPKRRGQLMYPIARNFAYGMKAILLDQIQWGEKFFGKKDSKPKLKLCWPVDSEQFSQFLDLFKPVMAAALMDNRGGFGLPSLVMPDVVSYTPSDFGEQGAFTYNYWLLYLNLASLKRVINNEETDSKSKSLIGVFVNTIFHEIRHCQQAFWIFALVQQYPQNFREISNIINWPTVSVSDIANPKDLARQVVKIASTAVIPEDRAALISLKRMAVGEYFDALHSWGKGLYRPTYLSAPGAFETEYQQSREVAKDLLQHVGLGGTAIDVDLMVADPPKCHRVDYCGRPWENDAFVTGDMAEAYWKEATGLLLFTNQADQCSYDYEISYIYHQRDLALQRPDSGKSGG